MSANTKLNIRPGDPITAQLLNDIANGRYAAGIRATGGVTVRQTPGGQIQIAGHFTGCFVGVVNSGGLTARSGSTLGNGSVEIQVKNPATGNYVDSGMAMTVDSISSTTGGVPSGTWVVCQFQDDGTPTLTSVDCGN